MQQKVERQLDEIIKLIKEINKSLGGNNENQQSTDADKDNHSLSH